MDEETQKIIMDQMKSLPADVKEAIISVDYQTKLQEITKRQKLLIDQAGKLEMETTLVMIGLEPLTDFISNVKRELNVTDVRAKEIAVDVSDNIFKPIRDSLQAMNQALETNEGPESENTEDMSAPRFTNSNEQNLNRDQILKEIEDPSLIDGGDTSMKSTISKAEIKPVVEIAKTTEIEIRPVQELETLPGEGVKDINPKTKTNDLDILQAKMTGTTVTKQQVINAVPEIKLPEVNKKPYKGVDPYREQM